MVIFHTFWYEISWLGLWNKIENRTQTNCCGDWVLRITVSKSEFDSVKDEGKDKFQICHICNYVNLTVTCIRNCLEVLHILWLLSTCQVSTRSAKKYEGTDGGTDADRMDKRMVGRRYGQMDIQIGVMGSFWNDNLMVWTRGIFQLFHRMMQNKHKNIL